MSDDLKLAATYLLSASHSLSGEDGEPVTPFMLDLAVFEAAAGLALLLRSPVSKDARASVLAQIETALRERAG